MDPDLHAVGQPQTVPLQQRPQLEADVGEQADGDGGLPVFPIVGQAEVHVPVALAEALHLPPHPDPFEEPAAERAVDRLGQLADREGGQAAVVQVEVEAGLAHGVRAEAKLGAMVRQYCPR